MNRKPRILVVLCIWAAVALCSTNARGQQPSGGSGVAKTMQVSGEDLRPQRAAEAHGKIKIEIPHEGAPIAHLRRIAGTLYVVDPTGCTVNLRIADEEGGMIWDGARFGRSEARILADVHGVKWSVSKQLPSVLDLKKVCALNIRAEVKDKTGDTAFTEISLGIEGHHDCD